MTILYLGWKFSIKKTFTLAADYIAVIFNLLLANKKAKTLLFIINYADLFIYYTILVPTAAALKDKEY